MNLLYGQIVEIASEDGMRVGKIRVAGAFKKISLELLGEAQIGDRVLVCDGIAISKEDPLEPPPLSEQPSAATQGQYSKAPPILQHSNTPPTGLKAPDETPSEPSPRFLKTNLCV
jgi:hydrogenase maturation factor